MLEAGSIFQTGSETLHTRDVLAIFFHRLEAFQLVSIRSTTAPVSPYLAPESKGTLVALVVRVHHGDVVFKLGDAGSTPVPKQ